MPERHTGENISRRIAEIISEFHLTDKVVAIMHDNARNMDAAFCKSPQFTSLHCFGHTIQLCIKGALDIPNVSKLLSRARKLVGHFKHSTTIAAELRKRQEVLNLPPHELIQDVATRWNSSQEMLERLSEQRRAVTDIMLDVTFTKKAMIKCY
jgi:hypothetical protein